mmetsp:Transcript_96353/g.176683  ORF Transcript_96353/g.176683 Transcript_96353/m.176683 type:complete len:763 (-) Transcript_96353:24-2312(-)
MVSTTSAEKQPTGSLHVLETFEERLRLTADMRGKRVLHVKGFGSSFKEPPEEEQGLDNKQEAEALLAMQNFAPDYLVVDGEPWGEGFQMYMKQYIEHQQQIGGLVPKLIWAKSTKLVSEKALLIDEEERNWRLEQAEEWAAQGFTVLVYWVCLERLNQKINKLFGHRFVEDNQFARFNARGIVQIMSDPLLPWVQGLAHDQHRSMLSKWLSNFLLWSILAIENVDRGDKQYFQKRSFENAAKGNLIFELLHNKFASKHGIVCFGGGESVLLEIATKYLNQNFEALHEDVAIFPFSRGRDAEDPMLPKYMGLSFITQSHRLTHLSRHLPSNCCCAVCMQYVNSSPVNASSADSIPTAAPVPSVPVAAPVDEVPVASLVVDETLVDAVAVVDAAPALSKQVSPMPIIDCEPQVKQEVKVDRNTIEESVRAWLETVTGHGSGDQTMAEFLRDGRVLCALANAVKPGSIRKVNSSKMPFKQMENISYFKNAARELGVPETSLFGTTDLFEEKNMESVLRCVCMFAGVVQVVCPEFSGPFLGPAIRPNTKEKKRASLGGQSSATSLAATPEQKKATTYVPEILIKSAKIASLPSEDANAKQAAKFDNDFEKEVCAWIEGVTFEKKGDQTMHEWLRSGEVLCRLANAVKPGLVPKINTGSVPFKQMENIIFFKDAARRVGVSEFTMFRTLDLYEEKNMGAVISCLQAFAGAVQVTCPEFTGPILGDALKANVSDKKRVDHLAVSQCEAMQRTMEEQRPTDVSVTPEVC